jgi:hypothetical protein
MLKIGQSKWLFQKDKIKTGLSLQLTKKKWVPHKNSQTPQNKFWVFLYSYIYGVWEPFSVCGGCLTLQEIFCFKCLLYWWNQMN